jgi:homoserine kinase
VIIEPQRKVLIPGFDQVKQAAITNGALGCSISGAGPTIFAWCEEPDAVAIRDAMVAAFAAHDMGTDAWISTLDPAGARVID